MKQLTCEMCGGTELIKQDGVFVCQNCGTKYSVDDAKKMMIEIDGTVEVTGTVKVDHTNKIANFYQLARMDIDKDSCGNAQKYYEGILLEEPTSWEAQFFVEYIKCWNSKVGELQTAPISFSNCMDSILNLIKTCLDDINEQRNALTIVCARSEKVFDMLFSAVKSRYDKKANEKPYIPSYKPDLTDFYNARCEKVNNERAARAELYRNCDAIFSILTKLGDGIGTIFADNEELKLYALKPWKKFVDNYMMLTKESGSENAKVKLGEYIAKIKKYDSTYLANDLPENTRLEIENALKNNNMILAIKIYRDFSGKGLAEAKSYIEEFALVSGIVIDSKQAKSSNLSGAEDAICFCGRMSVTPYTFFIGIFALCFVGKAKKENGGSLSKKAKRYLVMGVVGFCLWILLYIIIFFSIA